MANGIYTRKSDVSGQGASNYAIKDQSSEGVWVEEEQSWMACNLLLKYPGSSWSPGSEQEKTSDGSARAKWAC